MPPDSYFCILSLKVLTFCKSRSTFFSSFLELSPTVAQFVHATKAPFEEISGGCNPAQVTSSPCWLSVKY